MVAPYAGKVLRVDLSENKIVVENTRRDWAALYLGGRGLGIRYLYEEVPPSVGALWPDNRIIIATGPLTGTIAPLTGRFAVVTRSPKTGTLNDSYVGGAFGPELKYAGYDMMIVQGKAEKPVYISVRDGDVEIRDASHVWGKTVPEATEELKRDHGKLARVMVIGPAGENLSYMASVVVDEHFLAGRGGIGAVFGSKNLKGIVVEATDRKIDFPNPSRFRETVSRLMRESVLTETNLWAKTDGTPIIVDLSNNVGALPHLNFREGYYEYANYINTDVVKAKLDSRFACHSCPLACKRKIRTRRGVIKAPEYETIGMMGSNLSLKDMDELAHLGELADRLGLDTISLGATLGFLLEIRERGIISDEEIGFHVDWGEPESLERLIRKIAYREGIGNTLADGVKRAAERIGRGSERYAMHIKGSEIPAYDPRSSWGMALAYGTSDRGACHLRAWTIASEAFGDVPPLTFDGKAKLTKDLQDLNSVKWSLIICDFWIVGYREMADLLSATLDVDFKESYLQEVGERIWNLSRMYNVRVGFRRRDDYPPDRFFEEAHTKGPIKGVRLPREGYERALDEYYRLRGWDEDGVPTRETLDRLELSRDLGLS